MHILKKPKVLIIAGIVVLLAVALVLALVFLSPAKTVGLFGLDAAEAQHLQTRLEEEGYEVFFAKDPDELQSTDCSAWIVSAKTEALAEQIYDAVGEKALFIHRRPHLSTPVRFTGYHMENAGEILVDLIPLLPLGGDSNEDGTVSCLTLTGPSDWESQQWQKGLDANMAQSPLPVAILETLSCDYQETTAKAIVTEALAQYGRDIEVILCSSEILAEGAAKAISGRGWTQGKDFYLLSTGSLEKLDGRSGMAYVQEEAYLNLLCEAVEDTIQGEDPTDYLLTFKKINNSSPLK